MTEKPEASPHGDELREAAARAIWQAGANASTSKWENASYDAKLIVYQKADAALSLMQPEIDRIEALEAALRRCFKGETQAVRNERVLEAIENHRSKP